MALSRPWRERHECPGAGCPDGCARRAADFGSVVRHAVRRRDLPTRVRAHAPTRLDFAGAWTDVPPFSAREGGAVVNAAIALRAEVELEIGGPLIRLEAEDTGAVVECV